MQWSNIFALQRASLLNALLANNTKTAQATAAKVVVAGRLRDAAASIVNNLWVTTALRSLWPVELHFLLNWKAHVKLLEPLQLLAYTIMQAWHKSWINVAYKHIERAGIRAQSVSNNDLTVS